MQVQINPATIKGIISAPPSKSVMQRVCAAALLHNGETIVSNYGKSEDDKAAISIIQQLGATVKYKDEYVLHILSDG